MGTKKTEKCQRCQHFLEEHSPAYNDTLCMACGCKKFISVNEMIQMANAVIFAFDKLKANEKVNEYIATDTHQEYEQFVKDALNDLSPQDQQNVAAALRENPSLIDGLFTEQPEENDPVNHPSHYTRYKGIEIIQLTRQMDFNKGNAVKYIARAGHKDTAKEIEDLEKAIWYIKDEIAMLKGEV